ncbi:MAG TPA: response regulator [Chloroflexota bacterium]|nr:response regulator [Chloroflexota bacterium]
MVKLLIVEDDASVRSLVARAVAGTGWEILEAGDGASALDIVQREHPAVVLLDLGLPQMSGAEVCQRIKATPELHNTVVVMLTAFVDPLNLERCNEAGADRILTKPFSPLALRALLDAFRV